jgi:hypothetical protein
MEVEALAARVRALLAEEPMSEQRMFGGVAFLLNGNMLCCAGRRGLMVRIGRDAEPEALSQPFAAPCLGTGRPMAGFIMVDPAGLATDASLLHWLGLARDYVGSLPAKSGDRARVRNARPSRGAGS